MYSTKNIERILLAEYRRKKSILSETLNENTRNRYQKLNNIEQIRKILYSGKYSQALDNFYKQKNIYRGHYSLNGNIAVLVTPGIRKSQGLSNVYTRLMDDILPSWRNFPKRSHSNICTMDREYALEFGGDVSFIVFPKNNTKIGVTNAKDIWLSFPILHKQEQIPTMKDFNVLFVLFISKILDKSTSDIEDIFLSDTKIILATFREVEEKIRGSNESLIETSGVFINDLMNIIKQGYSITDYLNILMSPKLNDIQLSDVTSLPYCNNEIWFEGECLYIDSQHINSILIENSHFNSE